MKHYNIVFSIPIHEKFEVVIDQILNFFHFNPNCAIVLHISQGFNYSNSAITKDYFLEITKEIGNIYINPTSLRTGLSDIIQAHIANFNYVSQLCDFDYFSMSASNDLFIREGVFSEMQKYDAGLAFNDVEKNSSWDMGRMAYQDEDLKALMSYYGGDKVASAQIEGSYYKKSIFAEICEMINKFYDYNKMTIKYAREEIYFSTALRILDNQKSLRINKNGKYTWIDWKSNTLFVGITDVKRLDKEAGQYFCVKRCDRDLDNVLRAYIRQRFDYYSIVAKYVPELKKYSDTQLFLIESIRIVHDRYEKMIISIKRFILKILGR